MAEEETRRAGLSTIDTLHDSTNAFASAAAEEHSLHDLFFRRQRNACVDVQAANGSIQLRPTMENLIGDRFFPGAFALTYRRSILRYSPSWLARSVAARRLLGRLPRVENSPSAIEISTVVFADDLRVVHLVEINACSTPANEARRFIDFIVKENGALIKRAGHGGVRSEYG